MRAYVNLILIISILNILLFEIIIMLENEILKAFQNKLFYYLSFNNEKNLLKHNFLLFHTQKRKNNF